MTQPTTAPLSPAAAPAAPPAPPAPPVGWLVHRAALDDEARAAAAAALPAALAPGAADPALLVQALLEAGQVAGALRVVACALPPREGVWWAWLAARHAVQTLQARADAARSAASAGAGEGAGDQKAAAPPASPAPPALPPSAAQLAALAATERWVGHPTDEHRRAAWDAAQAAGLETAPGCVAAAVYFTGGSITPPHGPYVPPPAGVHVIMAATAALLAAVATDPARLAEVAGGFAQQGMELVRRLGGWDAAIAAAKETFDAQAHQHAEASKPPAPPGADA